MNKGAQSNLEDNFDANPLDAFNWENEGPTDTVTVTAPIVTKEELEDEDLPVETTKVKAEEKAEDIADDVFADWDDESKPEKETTPAKKEKTVVEDSTVEDTEITDDSEQEEVFYTSLAKEMKEKGVFTNLELEEDQKINKEKFLELQDEEVENRASEIVGELVKELKDDPAAAALLKFVKNGGSSAEFFATYATAPDNQFPEDFDLEQEKNQEKVIAHYLETVDGMDEEEIEEKLEWYKERGTTSKFAKKYHDKIVSIGQKQKEDLIKGQENRIKAIKESNEKLKTTLQAKLDSVDAIGDFSFSAAEKKTLADTIVKPTVKIGEGKFITSFQAKMKAIMNDPEKLLVLAKLVNNDFDTSELMTKATTKVVKKTKDTLREAKNSGKLSNRGSSAKTLADSF